MDLYKLTGGELHRLMKEKKVSAMEVTEDVFARMRRWKTGLVHSSQSRRRKQ